MHAPAPTHTHTYTHPHTHTLITSFLSVIEQKMSLDSHQASDSLADQFLIDQQRLGRLPQVTHVSCKSLNSSRLLRWALQHQGEGGALSGGYLSVASIQIQIVARLDLGWARWSPKETGSEWTGTKGCAEGTGSDLRSSKMRPTVVTDSRLTSIMGLSLEVWGKVLACRLGSRASLRPSYSSSWLCSGMLVLRDSSSWNSTALWTRRGQQDPGGRAPGTPSVLLRVGTEDRAYVLYSWM